jgi:nucleoside 2-deoxyribosyltransferase
LIKSCHVVVANLTPFRGPSCDVGTAYEIGFAHALGKIVFAYTNVTDSFAARTFKILGGKATRSRDGRLRDCNGMFIEENDLTDNLMLDGCIHVSSSCLIVEEAPPGQLFTFLGGFEKCLRKLKI